MASVVSASPGLFLNSPVGRGPIMRRYRRRAFFFWAVLAVLGIVPSLAGMPPPWRALGLGLWLPGGGFLYTASPHYLALALVLFAASLAAWLLMGGFIFPLLVWAGAAGLAALDAHGTLWPWAQFVTPLLAVGVVARSVAKEKRAAAGAVPRAELLKKHIGAIAFRVPRASTAVGPELSDQELGALRFTLDLALQPIDEFKGFVTIDQFREAAWRYQLVTISHALGILQTSRIPAFRGYLHEAQRRAIVKMCDRRVWRYWRIENAVGNLRFDPDPIKRDNIMYSGWWGLALGAYERATGDLQFSRPGALTLTESPTRKFTYDYPGIVEAMARNFDKDPLCLFPCEPNWVFTACNLYGITGMLVFDREHGTRWGLDRLAQFNERMEQEFTTGDGRAAVILAKRSGFIIAMNTPTAFGSTSQLLNMTSPRLAQVYWELCKLSLDEKFDKDRSRWTPEGAGMLDAGNYKKNGVFFWVGLMRAAREMGDLDIYDFARQRYDQMGVVARDGALHWKGSVLAQLTAHMARFGTEGAWHRLAHGDMPAAILEGPVLDEAPYPDVLVAAADNDGMKLTLTLCAGTGAGLHPLKFACLKPDGRYRLLSTEPGSGEASVIADARGNAGADVAVGARTRLELIPAA